mmetsp:Transcript_1514/g.3080  ORF Transcript_1514/g.3080 Transcript_1514/m.3080 type:complete len:627 (+) Transcript_1514:91-1971(+)
MTEVREFLTNQLNGSCKSIPPNAVFRHDHQYGLFASKSYEEGDIIFEESPLVILSPSLTTSSLESSEKIKRQFLKSSFASSNKEAKKTKATGKDDEEKVHSTQSSLLRDLIIPSATKSQLAYEAQIHKLRGMLLAAASYAVLDQNRKSEDGNAILTTETKQKIFELYHPHVSNSGGDDGDLDDETKNAIKLAQLAVQTCNELSDPQSNLRALVDRNNNADADHSNSIKHELLRLLLVYSCNAFEGGRIYHKLSRVNHSCNPNSVVSAGGDGSSGNDSSKSQDISVLRAACRIEVGEEITISYLGKYLYAGFPIRQKNLTVNKHFNCQCDRCINATEAEDDKKTRGDLASRIPCPICHPRTGRFLDEDVMFDDDADSDDPHAFKVCYAVPQNGMTAEERNLYCPSCKGTTFANPDGSIRKKKQGMSIKYMHVAEEKVYERLAGNGTGGSDDKASQDEDLHTERDIDQQFLQMATSTCGSQHWTVHFLNLSIMEESLASFHSTLMTIGENPEEDVETMEDLFTDIAEVADGLQRAYTFASSLQLKLDPAHWLFDYTVGLARTLVGLGDEKSQKYGADWITRVENYAQKFEAQDMQKVVKAIKDAWNRGQKHSDEKEGDGPDRKRRKNH